MMMQRMFFFGLFVMRTVPSSIGSGSESLLTCSKFHFEEKVLEKLVRLEHKVEIYEETVKRWENVFVSKLENLDTVQKQSETFFKSMQAAQVQEEIRLNKSYSDIIDTFKSQMNNDTEFYENLLNNLFETGSLKIQNKFQTFKEKTRFLTNNQNELNRKLCNNIRTNVSNSFQNMESKQNATYVEVLNALSEIKTLDGKFAQESVKLKTLEGKFAQESVQMKILEGKFAEESVKHKTIESKFAEESVKIKTLEDKFAEKSVNIRTLESKFAQESVKIKILEEKFEEFGAKTKNLERQVADNNCYRKVAITACVSSSASYSGSVKFSNVQTQIGINNNAAFKLNGKFVCEIAGLYHISAYIRTSTKNSAFYVFKNNKQISRSASGSGTYTDVPISAVVELQTNDQLYVHVSHYVYAADSCVTIAKIN